MNDEKNFYLRYAGSDYAEAEVLANMRLRVASAMVARGGEADLALCLAALVEAGVLDIEKLRAALVLAEPVAREKVATMSEVP